MVRKIERIKRVFCYKKKESNNAIQHMNQDSTKSNDQNLPSDGQNNNINEKNSNLNNSTPSDQSSDQSSNANLFPTEPSKFISNISGIQSDQESSQSQELNQNQKENKSQSQNQNQKENQNQKQTTVQSILKTSSNTLNNNNSTSTSKIQFNESPTNASDEYLEEEEEYTLEKLYANDPPPGSTPNIDSNKLSRQNTKAKIPLKNSTIFSFSQPNRKIQKKEMDEEIIKGLMSRKDPSTIPLENIDNIVYHVTEIRDQSLMTHKIKKAEKADKLLLVLSERKKKQMKLCAYDSYLEDLKAREERAEKRHQKLVQGYHNYVKKLHEEKSEQLQKLQQKHQKQEDDFYAQYDQPTKTRELSKASINLQRIRQQTVLLFNCRRYDEVKQLEGIVHDLEAKEVEEKMRVRSIEIYDGLKRLKKKQQEEITAFEMLYKTKEDAMKIDYEKSYAASKKRIENIKGLISNSNEETVWNRLHRNDLPSINRGIQTSILQRQSMNMRAITSLSLPPISHPSYINNKSRPQSSLTLSRTKRKPI